MTLLDNKLSIIQTDKPIYRHGEKVRFWILTLWSSMIPRPLRIHSIYIKDPNHTRVKQYLNLVTHGIISLEFPLHVEFLTGEWKIEVNLDQNKTVIEKFTVKHYDPNQMEIMIEPPPYILQSDKNISGRVCSSFLDGEPVTGNLSLDVCWSTRIKSHDSTFPCYPMKVQLDGCYNFSMNDSFMAAGSSFPMLEIRANVISNWTGVTLSKTHRGPVKSEEPLKIRLDDYTNGFFKPGLPYHGKVIVTKLDGTPAPGETIVVTARSKDNSFHFSREFTTNETGEIGFVLCESLTTVTSLMISAESTRYQTPILYHDYSLWVNFDIHNSSMSNVRYVPQWFSPSRSYIQLPKIDSPHLCGQKLARPVLYTARTESKVLFYYQVTARGQMAKTGHMYLDPVAGVGEALPPSSNCLHRGSSSRATREDGITDPGMPEGGQFPKTEDEEIQKRERAERSDMKVFHFWLDVKIKPIMSPKFSLLLYHVLEDGEVVADSMQYDVEPCFDNQVKLEFSVNDSIPADKVNLTLNAAPRSICVVGVVDKIVPEKTLAKIFHNFKEFTNPWHGPNTLRDRSIYICMDRKKKEGGLNNTHRDPWLYRSEYVDSYEAFKISGNIVITDLKLKTRPCSEHDPYYDKPPKAPEIEPYEVDQSETFTPFFHETWIWTMVNTGPMGEVVLTETVPEAITTWSAKAMCVSKAKGFGISEMTLLKTIQPFYISVLQPYAAVRGERLPVKLRVYNLLHRCISFRVTIKWSVSFIVHKLGRLPGTVCICGDEFYHKHFYVTSRDVGSLPIEAKATVVAPKCPRETRDINLNYIGMSHKVEKKIRVKAKGVEQSYTYASYFCSEDGKLISEEVPLQLPKGKEIIKNSAFGEVQVIGDIMGAALNNLEKLVSMPTGCGEQNMIGFVANILVLNYLNSTGNLQETTRQAALNNMEKGYQRALNYRHKDGSFSAFGNKDPKGSIWLTAFVVKSFAQAQKHIFVDEIDLQRSLNFLVGSQLETGCFRETGKVFSSYMMGGLGQGWGQKNRRSPEGALTAYVLMALMEAGGDTNKTTIDLGIECMNDELNLHKNGLDPYTLALVTLANMKYNSTSPDAQFAFKTLHEKALKDDKHIYWTRGKRNPFATRTNIYPAAPSAEVEMAAYALMSYLQFSPKHAEKIAMWLSRQRNSFGGFSSTQDTVVALEALSQFAASAYSQDPTKLKVKVIFNSTASSASVEFYLSENENKTRFLLQSEPIPALPSTLHISTSGTGCALVQANVRYNKPAKAYVKGEKPNFTLKIYTRKYQHDRNKCDYRTLYFRLKSCAFLCHSVPGVTGWDNQELDRLYYDIRERHKQLESLPPKIGIKKAEYVKEEGLLHLYFDEFSNKVKRFSVDVVQDQDLRVDKPKTADARVVEYYETGVTTVQRYRIKTTCEKNAKKQGKGKDAFETPDTWEEKRQKWLSLILIGPSYTNQLAAILAAAQSGTGTNASSNCPACITNKWKIPANFSSAVCKSSA
ncbi:alpha-2-macroglobulin-like protein, partial [Plakobranchus ocellatus]